MRLLFRIFILGPLIGSLFSLLMMCLFGIVLAKMLLGVPPETSLHFLGQVGKGMIEVIFAILNNTRRG